jgi:hypothetical protein
MKLTPRLVAPGNGLKRVSGRNGGMAKLTGEALAAGAAGAASSDALGAGFATCGSLLIVAAGADATGTG